MEEERAVDSENAGGGRGEGLSANDSQPEGGDGLISSSADSKKGKSCKGCLYYSSILKSKSRNPLCVGISRSLPQVPRYIVGESEMEASKEGRSLADFKYACVGYSVYTNRKDQSNDVQEVQTELPVCVGLEVLVDRRATNADTTPVPVLSRDGGRVSPQPQTHKPPHSLGDEFLTRFSRNASLVATGVAKNLRKVGNQIKESVNDIFYPYGRRPK